MRIFLLAISLLHLQACGLAQKTLGIRKKKDTTATAVSGSILSAMNELNESKWTDSCDDIYREPKLELARALDQRAKAIADFAASQPDSGQYVRVKMGPIYVKELVEPFVPQKGWLTYNYDWKELIDTYQNIKATPVDEKWAKLESWTRAQLVDDKARLIYNDNVYLERRDYPVVTSILLELNICLLDSDCTWPKFDKADEELLQRNMIYRAILDTQYKDQRVMLAKLQEWVEFDHQETAMTRNLTVRRSEDGKFILPLDPGPFADVTDTLARYIEGVWKSDKHQLKIEWVSRADNPDAFLFVLGPGLGRAFVRYSDKTVNLFNDDRAVTIAHEIGHVLGFPDRYFTTYSEQRCHYTVEYSEEDIMSTSEAPVSENEWKDLEALYPVR